MKKGKITKVTDRGFFFIDNDYWCHNNSYSKEPEVDDIVEYEAITRSDGKKNAQNVRFIKKGLSLLDEYFDELNDSYFINSNSYNLKPTMIIQYPATLAKVFQKDNKNKPSQIRKYFDSCRIIEGKFKLSKDFDFVITELYKLIPLANNAKVKGHVSNEFFEFFETNIEQAIKSPNHFQKGFMAHFESVIGFYIQK